MGSGIEHNEKVQTTESTDDVGKSILSAEDKLNSISKLTLSAFFLAILLSSSEGSIPITLLTFSMLYYCKFNPGPTPISTTSPVAKGTTFFL